MITQKEQFDIDLEEFGNMSLQLISETVSIRNMGINQNLSARHLGEKACQLQKIYKENKYHLETEMKWKAFVQSKLSIGLDYQSVTRYKLIYLNWDIITEKGWDVTKTYSQLIHQVLPAYKKHLKSPVSPDEFDNILDEAEASKIQYQRVSREKLQQLEVSQRELYLAKEHIKVLESHVRLCDVEFVPWSL